MRWLIDLARRGRMRRELAEEVNSHIGEKIADLVEAGMPEREARQKAKREFGNAALYLEVSHEVWGWMPVERLLQDLRYGWRILRRNPGFTAAAVLILALGIGANTALFSVVNGVLISPLPYPSPEQLVALHQSKPNFEAGAITYPNFRDWQKDNQTFSAMAITRSQSFTLSGEGDVERVAARLVSAELFTVLGVRLPLGRDFTVAEDQPKAAAVIILSAGFWQREFGGAPDVVGRSLTLDHKSYSIIGVLPPGGAVFRGADVFALLGQWDVPALRNRSAGLGLHGIGRLKPGISLAQARADMDRVTRNLAAAFPDANRGNGATLIPLKEQLVGDVRSSLLILTGAVGFVLLIACVNVSNLLLARSTFRTREFAMRAALGASQWRLLRQALLESVLLAVLGSVLGLLVAGWGTQAALKQLPTALPRADELGLDGRVLLFALGVAFLTGVLSGSVPALRNSRWHLSGRLKEGGRGGMRHRAQGVLVAVEMALAVVLLVGAGLMIRTLSALWDVDPGFRPDNVISFSLNFPPAMRTATAELAHVNARNLSDRLNTIAGVHAASFSDGALPLQSEDDLFFWVDGEPKPASTSQMSMALVYRVEPGYLAAMGIPIKRGRFFTDRDDEGSPAVAVIDEVFARRNFANVNPIGRRIHVGEGRDPVQIVGVVGHVKQWSLGADDKQTLQAQLYEPLRQFPGSPDGVSVVMRADRVGPALWDSIRRVVREQSSQNVIYAAQTMHEVLGSSLAEQRFMMIVLDAFAISALLLASVGIYGVISYLVGRRTHEFGVRLALGAQCSDIVRLVLIHGMKMALAGLALGLIAALGLTRLMSEMLYGVSATDPAIFSLIALLLTAMALLACVGPARRATRVDPLVAVRHE